MHCKYTLQCTALCPVDRTRDFYTITITSDEPVMVERIHEIVKVCTSNPITQEDLTKQLATYLGQRVDSIGYHSNVKVEVSS